MVCEPHKRRLRAHRPNHPLNDDTALKVKKPSGSDGLGPNQRISSFAARLCSRSGWRFATKYPTVARYPQSFSVEELIRSMPGNRQGAPSGSICATPLNKNLPSRGRYRLLPKTPRVSPPRSAFAEGPQSKHPEWHREIRRFAFLSDRRQALRRAAIPFAEGCKFRPTQKRRRYHIPHETAGRNFLKSSPDKQRVEVHLLPRKRFRQKSLSKGAHPCPRRERGRRPPGRRHSAEEDFRTRLSPTSSIKASASTRTRATWNSCNLASAARARWRLLPDRYLSPNESRSPAMISRSSRPSLLQAVHLDTPAAPGMRHHPRPDLASPAHGFIPHARRRDTR